MGGAGWGWNFLITENFFATKFFFKKRMHKFLNKNDTLLPMTMTCDWLKFWSGPAWRSKKLSSGNLGGG